MCVWESDKHTHCQSQLSSTTPPTTHSLQISHNIRKPSKSNQITDDGEVATGNVTQTTSNGFTDANRQRAASTGGAA